MNNSALSQTGKAVERLSGQLNREGFENLPHQKIQNGRAQGEVLFSPGIIYPCFLPPASQTEVQQPHPSHGIQLPFFIDSWSGNGAHTYTTTISTGLANTDFRATLNDQLFLDRLFTLILAEGILSGTNKFNITLLKPLSALFCPGKGTNGSKFYFKKINVCYVGLGKTDQLLGIHCSCYSAIGICKIACNHMRHNSRSQSTSKS